MLFNEVLKLKRFKIKQHYSGEKKEKDSRAYKASGMLKFIGINLEKYKYFRLFNRIMFKLRNGKLEWETFNQWNVFIRSHNIHGIYSPKAIYSQNNFCKSVSRNYVFYDILGLHW